MPSWLPAVLTIADFITQRVDRAGPISFEPPEKQPPERARVVAPPAGEETTAADTSTSAASERGSTADGDGSPLGFQARGGNADPTERDDDEEEDANGPEGRAGGNTDPSSGNGGGGGGTDPDADNNERRCSFRSMRVKDRPTTYEA